MGAILIRVFQVTLLKFYIQQVFRKYIYILDSVDASDLCTDFFLETILICVNSAGNDDVAKQDILRT